MVFDDVSDGRIGPYVNHVGGNSANPARSDFDYDI
jgi:hypothetical protein